MLHETWPTLPNMSRKSDLSATGRGIGPLVAVYKPGWSPCTVAGEFMLVAAPFATSCVTLCWFTLVHVGFMLVYVGFMVPLAPISGAFLLGGGENVLFRVDSACLWPVRREPEPSMAVCGRGQGSCTVPKTFMLVRAHSAPSCVTLCWFMLVYVGFMLVYVGAT